MFMNPNLKNQVWLVTSTSCFFHACIMFHIPMICILWPYLIYVHMQIILDGMENFHPEQVAIDSIATDDVAIVPLFI